MAKIRVGWATLAAGLLLWGAAPVWAQRVTVDQILAFRPLQPDVVYTIPTAEELKGCEVKVERGGLSKSSGYVLLDAKKIPLRRFFDSDGDEKVDLWSYYKDGVEVYREIDTNRNERPDQYRWLNDGGTKWGIDKDEDRKIEKWLQISAEEVAQEAYLAVARRDFDRLRALFITDAELKDLKLPNDQMDQIRNQLTKAQSKFQDTIAKRPQLTEKAKFERVESAVPQCVLGETFNSKQDLIKYPTRAILYQGADTKHEWINTGAMLQVGQAWRLVDAPTPGDILPSPGQQDSAAGPTNKNLEQLFKKLSDMDSKAQQLGADLAATARYYGDRTSLLEQILVEDKDQSEMWTKQLADNLSMLVQSNGENDPAVKTALQRLEQLREQAVKASAGSNLAAYVTYRELWAKYSSPSASKDPKLLQQRQERLEEFVSRYPKAEDTPDALIDLGMSSESNGKGEEARRWYQQLVTNFAGHALLEKAQGCLRRLDLKGKSLELKAPTLDGAPFDVAKRKGKVVVVYFWTSQVNVCIGDFARLKQLQATYADKGLELVTVNLDDRKEDAQRFLQSNPLPGTHLFQATEQAKGLNSPLANQYGIFGLPTVFLVGKNGNVIDTILQVNDLEDQIKKAW